MSSPTLDRAADQERPHRRNRERAERIPLEAGCLTDQSRQLAENLRSRVIGQDDAIDTLVCSFARLISGLRDPGRPVLTVLMLGPTGVGKTETARALAHTLFGSERALTRVNCEEYAHGHELSKLLGSPPGYVGYQIEPLLSQRRLDAAHKRALDDGTGLLGEGHVELNRAFPAAEGRHLSVALFDEIEKAHPLVWNALLGMLDDGMLTLGDNRTTDFTRSIILATSNVGSREMSDLLEHSPMGFARNEEEQGSRDLSATALAAARNAFPLEFLNRFDEVLVYSALQPEHLGAIFDKLLQDVQRRSLEQARCPLLLKVSDSGRQRIIESGTDLRFGARPLRRAVERLLVDPLSRLIAARELEPGDVVEIEAGETGLRLFRSAEPRGRVIVA